MRKFFLLCICFSVVFVCNAQAPKKKKKKAKPEAATEAPVRQTKAQKDMAEYKARYYDAERVISGSPWYGNHFSPWTVKERYLPLDSIPDEIHIRLVNNDNEFCFPVKNKNYRTSPYGWRWNRPHRGVDIGLYMGEPVHTVFPGVVRVATQMGGYGNVIVVRHYNGLESVYGHLSKIKVKPRQVVGPGEVIGLGGSTGHSTGPHLHFEIRFMYEAFDPEWILDFSTYSLRTRRLYLDKTYFGIFAPSRQNPQDYKADKSYIEEKKVRALGEPQERSVVVQYGDTYEAIAQRNRTTVQAIFDLNPGIPKKRPKEGTSLRVK